LGCLYEINKAAVDVYDVITIGYRELEGIDDLIDGKVKLKELAESNVLYEHLDYLRGSFSRMDRIRVLMQSLRRCSGRFMTYITPGFGPRSLLPWYEKSFYIRIEKGCLGACTFCAIRFAAGRLSSQRLEDIQAQFRLGLDQGFHLFRLLGEDVGAYGLDLNSNIVELLDVLFRFRDKFQIVIEDLSPKWLIQFSDGFQRIISDNHERIHHIVVPVQTGSPAILRSMRRGYRVEDVEATIRNLREISPDTLLTTHVVVGFPGETENDFLKTIALLDRCNFNHIIVHRYTDRPNTFASKLPCKVPEREQIKRLWRLRKKFPETIAIRI